MRREFLCGTAGNLVGFATAGDEGGNLGIEGTGTFMRGKSCRIERSGHFDRLCLCLGNIAHQCGHIAACRMRGLAQCFGITRQCGNVAAQMVGNRTQPLGGVFANRGQLVGMGCNIGTLCIDPCRDTGHNGLQPTLFTAKCRRNALKPPGFAAACPHDQ